MKLSLALCLGAVLLSACGSTARPTATQTEAVTAPSASPAVTAGPTALATTDAPSAPAPTATPLPDSTSVGSPTPAGPQVIDPAAYQFAPVSGGFSRPVLVTHAGDGSNRLFVVEQGGLIRVIRDGQVLPEPFLDVTNLVTQGGSEQGLLGLAFHTEYAGNGLFFIDYTDARGDSVVARYSVAAGDPNRAEPGSAEVILTQQQPYPNHNGGQLAFGPDGYLYIGLGDGGSGGDPHGNAQNLKTWLGKLLRIDVNSTADGKAFGTPPDNPFANDPNALPEIWVYGLRNPWRFTFDRGTGDMFIGDVGQNAYEEVDFQAAGSAGGENYGWNYFEGLHPFEGKPPADLELAPPVAEYPQDGNGCAVTGGYVYRGPSLAALNGVYFYGDYCTGKTWSLTHAGDQWNATAFMDTDDTISSWGEDEAGELYVVNYDGGTINRLQAAP